MWGTERPNLDQSPLANVLGYLAQMSELQGQLHQVQNGVLLEIARSLAADRAILCELVTSVGGGDGYRAAVAVPHIHIQKMGERNNAEAFLETFQGVAEVSRWPCQEWAHHLLPLLTGEAQPAAQSLTAVSQRDYDAVARAIQDWLGLNPEEHRCRFRALVLTEGDRPFACAQQLSDRARR